MRESRIYAKGLILILYCLLLTHLQVDAQVIKKDNSLEIFDKNKILNGLIKACYKRPVTKEQISAIADDVEKELENSLKNEFKSTDIGIMVMERLKQIDEVSYVRFASVYREFKDVETFMQELNELKLLKMQQ